MKGVEASLEHYKFIHLLPWRDKIRNYTHLPEEDNFLKGLIEIWGFSEGGAQLHSSL